VIEIKLAPLLLSEFNEGKEEFKPLRILVANELFEKKIKVYMSRPITKPSWEDVTLDSKTEGF